MVSQKADERGIDKYMFIASPVVRERQRACSYSRMMNKLSSLLVQESHPLQVTLTALSSSFSNRLIHPKGLIY